MKATESGVPAPPPNTATVQHPESGGPDTPSDPNSARHAELWEQCKSLAPELRILDRFAIDVERSGVVGRRLNLLSTRSGYRIQMGVYARRKFK